MSYLALITSLMREIMMRLRNTKLADLSWNGEEGSVRFTPDWGESNRTIQLDAIVDWRHELELLYNSMLLSPDYVATGQKHANDFLRERRDFDGDVGNDG